MPRRYNYPAERSRWTQDQLDQVAVLIDEAEQGGFKVQWADYVEELGHPKSSVACVASHMRDKRRAEKQRVQNAALRAFADGNPAPAIPRRQSRARATAWPDLQNPSKKSHSASKTIASAHQRKS